MVIYLDETGDLGFNFSRSRTSKFFVISALIFNKSQHYRRVMMSLEKTKRVEGIYEIKGKSLQLEKREKLHFLIKKLDWELHALVIDKRKVIKPDAIACFYDDMVTRLLIYCYQKKQSKAFNLKIIIDKSKNNQQEIIAINSKIEKGLRKYNCQLDINIHHSNSSQEMGLQMVDLYSYGIYKKFESGEEGWFLAYKDKVKTLLKI